MNRAGDPPSTAPVESGGPVDSEVPVGPVGPVGPVDPVGAREGVLVQPTHVPVSTEQGTTAEAFSAQALTSLISRNGAAAVLAIVMVIGFLTVPTFGTADNLRNTALAASFLAIISAGMTFVIISGGIDLSVGSLYALAVILCADMSKHGSWAAIGIPILVCAFVGSVQGFVIARLRLPPFIVTLAGLTGIRGLVFYITKEGNSHPSVAGNPFFETLSKGSFLTIKNPVWIALVVFAIGWCVLNRTAFGQGVQAVGGSDTSAALMGLPVRRVKILVYAISGVTVGISGVLSTGLSGGGQEARVGNAYELSAIAAVVIGGTLLSGGVGSIVGSLFGITLLYVIQNLVVQGFNFNSYVQQVVSGFFLLIVVILQAVLSRRSEADS